MRKKPCNACINLWNIRCSYMVATCIHPFKAVDPASPLSSLSPNINQLQL